MRNQCLTCKYYITEEDDCEKDYPEVCLEKYKCGEYEPRFKKDECGHRYEDCRDCMPNCTNVCMRKPSEHHCTFKYICDLDRWVCDENCERHERRKNMKDSRAELERLVETKKMVDAYRSAYPGKSIETIDDHISELRQSIEEMRKQVEIDNKQ